MTTTRLRRGVRAAILSLAALGTTLGCDISIESTGHEEEPARLAFSLTDGATVRQGDLIDVAVVLPEAPQAPDSTADDEDGDAPAAHSVEVELQSSDGSIVTSRAFPYLPGDVFPSLTLDDLGLSTQGYRLMVRLLRGDELLEQKVVEFVYLGEEYELAEITSDAASIHPGSTVGLTAELRVPDGADPVLEWSHQGVPFARGTLGEGLDSVQWTSPAAEGIYTITATMYPLSQLRASVALSADIYVAVVADPSGELGSASSYRGLYHLLGDLSDASEALESGEFLAGEPLALVTRGRLVGYRLDGQAGFSIPDFLVPVGSDAIEPFTITFGYTPEGEGTQGPLIRSASADGTVELSVMLEQAGPWIVAQLRHPAATERLAADAATLLPDTRYELSFSLSPSPPPATPAGDAADTEPAEGTLIAQWFLDGLPVSTAEWAAPLPPAIAGGSTTIGGPGSPRGIVDEIGVYVRDAEGRPATNAGIYAGRIAGLHGASAAADGFDGMWLPPAYTVQGDVVVRSGLLEVRPGASLELPAYPLGRTGLRILLDLAGTPDPSGVVSVSWSEAGGGAQLVSLAGSGRLSVGGLEETVRLWPSREIALTLRAESGQTRVGIEGINRAGSEPATFTIPGPIPEGAAVVVRLADGQDATAPFFLDSYAIWQLD